MSYVKALINKENSDRNRKTHHLLRGHVNTLSVLHTPREREGKRESEIERARVRERE